MAVLRLITSSNLVGCMHRQVGRLLALEDAAGIDAGLAIRIGEAGAVAHQAAGLDELAQRIDRGHRVAGRQRDERSRRLVKNGSAVDEQRAGACRWTSVAKACSISRSVLASGHRVAARAHAAAVRTSLRESAR